MDGLYRRTVDLWCVTCPCCRRRAGPYYKKLLARRIRAALKLELQQQVDDDTLCA